MSFSDSTKATKHNDEPSSKLSQQLSTLNRQGFDYDVLTPEIRIIVRGKTSELKSLMRRSAQDIIDIGQKLLEVKEQLGHGNFRDWLKAEFEWSVRTAARFMQVTTQFKNANLAHLNIAVSALYLLAEPSTPEKARQEILELAKKGENITYTKAKTIVSESQELDRPNVFPSTTVDISAQAMEDNLLTASEPCRSLPTHERLELKDEVNSGATGLLVETVPTKECYKDWLSKEDSEVAAELQPQVSNHIRILSIEQKNPESSANLPRAFELTFAGVRVDLEGNPEALLVLFEQMHNNPVFVQEIIQQAKLLALHHCEMI
jgi:hypothetical protein